MSMLNGKGEEEEEPPPVISKQDKRAQKKQRKLIAEFTMTQTNDELKRPGELLDTSGAKKLRIDPGENKRLSPEEFKELKKLLNERKRVLTQLPRFLLAGAGSASSLTIDHDVREPIFMSDVQQLLLHALCGNSITPAPTRWCSIQKFQRLTHIVTLIVEGLTTRDFASYEHLFPKLTAQFSDRVELMAPVYYGKNMAEELSCVPLSNAQKESIIKKYGSMEKAVAQKEIVRQFRALFPTHIVKAQDQEDPVPHPLTNDIPPCDTFPRTFLLMGLSQLTLEGYPMPFWAQMAAKCAGYKLSKEKYKEVSAQSPMFAIDCEMCITASNPSELTRIAVVNEKLETVYESYVKPKEKITNYLTQFSGITEEMLKNVTTTLEDVQETIIRLLPEDSIWIGQSLNCDLHALKMMHPYVIDTSLIFNLSGITGRKSKLAHMAQEFLEEDIQSSKHGHCPIEDAKAAMKLVQLKLSKGFLFGDHTYSTDNLDIPESVNVTSILNQAYKSQKTVAIIGRESVLQEYENVTITPPEGTAFTSLKISSNDEAISKLTEVATSHQLTIAHIDVSEKLEEKKQKKKEKLFKKVDQWCEQVFNHVSLNGMCIIVFSGPKSNPLAPNPSKVNAVNDDNSSESLSSVPISSNPDQPKEEEKVRKKPRQNGVCFIRVKTKRI